jgi:hypothetical protein
VSTTFGGLKATRWYKAFRDWRHRRRQARELRDWERNGRQAPPPPVIKRRMIRAYAEKYGLRVFVETGTYRGDTVDAMKDLFDRIYSIEIGRELFEKARERFRSAKHIEIIHGDSGEELGRVMKKLDRPALFYLDGHYSAQDTARGKKDTPIYEELGHILSSSETRHVILIDDARCFGTDPAYPSLAELTEFIRARRGNVQISVEDDCVRIAPG